ncbi:hypothetical protein [Tenacibaculum maritimum]|uniref:hypothetical protein n=1 Tax=Tenacibaculum maritimum TaxID=107401 RepID=UPI0012E6BE01|nr:hypothetical protein [Tenacibaculum maritimum]CAA0219503.1 conserved hypothetical protein [Tenacibaculum maritimum]
MKIKYLAILVSCLLVVSCKKELQKKEVSIVEQMSYSTYQDLIGKTFFEVSEINGNFYYKYKDFNFDMVHHEFKFNQKYIDHLDPMEWAKLKIVLYDVNERTINVKSIYESGIEVNLYFQYNKENHTLKYSKSANFSDYLMLFDKSKLNLVKHPISKKKQLNFKSSLDINRTYGEWSISCENLREYYNTFTVTNENDFAYLTPFDQEDFIIPCSYELSNNSLVLRLHKDASKTRLVDFTKYSKDSIIGHFGFNNENRGKLYWYGIYNKEKKKRDYHTIIFNQEKNEEGIESPIVLEKCD